MGQQTLAQAFTLEGIGIHTGAQGKIRVLPAEADTGRVFQVGQTTIPARADYVVDTSRCTTLGKDEARVSTVEHLLSALHGCGVDNAVIEVTGPEIPILDGSARPFAEAILAAGVAPQHRPPRVFAAPKRLCEVKSGESRAFALPETRADFRVEVRTEFDAWEEGRATMEATLDAASSSHYLSAIAPARTFAFRQEVDYLIAAGLAKGGSLDNALIITPPDTFSSPLRLPNEWCAHKMLDVIGDLALLDARPQFHLVAIRPGHRLNVLLAQALLAQRTTQEE